MAALGTSIMVPILYWTLLPRVRVSDRVSDIVKVRVRVSDIVKIRVRDFDHGAYPVLDSLA
jgi:hypothetical protein